MCLTVLSVLGSFECPRLWSPYIKTSQNLSKSKSRLFFLLSIQNYKSDLKSLTFLVNESSPYPDTALLQLYSGFSHPEMQEKPDLWMTHTYQRCQPIASWMSVFLFLKVSRLISPVHSFIHLKAVNIHERNFLCSSHDSYVIKKYRLIWNSFLFSTDLIMIEECLKVGCVGFET